MIVASFFSFALFALTHQLKCPRSYQQYTRHTKCLKLIHNSGNYYQNNEYWAVCRRDFPGAEYANIQSEAEMYGVAEFVRENLQPEDKFVYTGVHCSNRDKKLHWIAALFRHPEFLQRGTETNCYQLKRKGTQCFAFLGYNYRKDLLYYKLYPMSCEYEGQVATLCQHEGFPDYPLTN